MLLGKFLEEPSSCNTWSTAWGAQKCCRPPLCLGLWLRSSHVGKGLPCCLHLDKLLSTEQSLGVIVRSPSPGALGTPVISVSSVSLWSSYGLASI